MAPARGMLSSPLRRGQPALQILPSRDQQPLAIDVLESSPPEATQPMPYLGLSAANNSLARVQKCGGRACAMIGPVPGSRSANNRKSAGNLRRSGWISQVGGANREW